MVESFVQYELKGACEFHFDQSGFRFELECRLDHAGEQPQRPITDSEAVSAVTH